MIALVWRLAALLRRLLRPRPSVAGSAAPVPSRTAEDVTASVEVSRLLAAAAARAPWACWGCWPVMTADFHDGAITISTVHSAQCIAAADWLVNARDEPPPGVMVDRLPAPPPQGGTAG